MWEVKYATPNGSIDFMWYGSDVTHEEAEQRFRSLPDLGLEPISYRIVSQLPTNHEYLAMCSKAQEDHGRYLVITYGHSSGVAEKRKYASVEKAALMARGYVNGAEPLNSGPIYDAAIVYDSKQKCATKAYWNDPRGLADNKGHGSLSMRCAHSGTLDLCSPDWKERLEGHFKFALAKQFQHQHIRSSGGWLEVRESDDTHNDLNRELLAAMKQIYGHVYLGNVNYYDERREQICTGKASVYEEYTGQKIFNFHCSFAVPVKDDRLEQMIRDWNKGTASGQSVEQIMERIDELGGEHFIWF